VIRTLTSLATVLAIGACESFDAAAYDPQSRPPPLTISVSSQCLPEGLFIAQPSPDAPTPTARCAPQYPMRAMEAGLTGSCISLFTISADGSVATPTTTCNVGNATRAEWRTYGKAVFEAAAQGAVARYTFAPEDGAKWQGQRFGIRTIFAFADEPLPEPPSLPVDVVEVLTPNPAS
jgi:hypothetical protein